MSVALMQYLEKRSDIVYGKVGSELQHDRNPFQHRIVRLYPLSLGLAYVCQCEDCNVPQFDLVNPYTP